MRIIVDRNRCNATGICESMAPSFFEVNDEGELLVLREDVSDEDRTLIEQTIIGCPTGALSLTDQ